MNASRHATRPVVSIVSSILIASIGALGCGDDGAVDAGSQKAEVTANNFADLAAASAEAARAAYVAEATARGIGILVYRQLIDVAPIVADPAGPMAALVDPLCDAGGASTLTPDPSNPDRYGIDFDQCGVFDGSLTCTIDGQMLVEEGAFGGDPFVSSGTNLTVDCGVFGEVDLDGSRVECPYLVDDGGPTNNPDDCEFEIAGLRGDVTGLVFEVTEVDISGYSYDFDVLATIVDPDYGQLSFEALNLDIDTCEWAVPFTGLIGGGQEQNVAPAFWAIFDGSCDAFTACYFETQADLDDLECTLTSVVQWDDIAAPATEGVVQPVSVVATSYYNAGTAPVHLIDGSGLSGVGELETQTHAGDGNASGMWHAGPIEGALGGPVGDPPAVAGQALEFDLGINLDLEGTYVWNIFQTGQTARGIDEFEILVSSSTDGPFVSLGTFGLQKNSDDPRQVGTIAQFRAFEAANVRRVRFAIASAHSGELAEYVGLSEVAFLASGPSQ